MDDAGRRQRYRPAALERAHGISLLRSPRQPLPPARATQWWKPARRRIAGDAVVTVVTAQFLTQYLVLLRKRSVAVHPAPGRSGATPDSALEAVRRLITQGLSASDPVVGEARSQSSAPRPGPPRSPGVSLAGGEGDQPSLVRVQGQTILANRCGRRPKPAGRLPLAKPRTR